MHGSQRRRKQLLHQRLGDPGLFAVQAGRRQGGARPGREQAGEDFLALGEGLLGAGPQQDQRARGHAVTGQRSHDHGADRSGEPVGHHPVREVVRVDPAGRHGREALKGLVQARHGGHVDPPRDMAHPSAALGVGQRVPPPLRRGDEDGGLGEKFRGHGGGGLHAAPHVQRRQERARHLGEYPGAPLGVVQRLGRATVGLLDQPPHDVAVGAGRGVRRVEAVLDAAGEGRVGRGVQPLADPAVGVREPGRDPLVQGLAVNGSGQQGAGRAVHPDEAAVAVGDEDRTGGVRPRRADRAVGVGRAGGNAAGNSHKWRHASCAPHHLPAMEKRCRTATVPHPPPGCNPLLPVSP